MTRDWAAKHGLTLFPEAGFASLTLTCVEQWGQAGRNVVDVPTLQKRVKDRGLLIDGGYGKIKGTTFRISNMGDETEETMGELIDALDDASRTSRKTTPNQFQSFSGTAFNSSAVKEVV